MAAQMAVPSLVCSTTDGIARKRSRLEVKFLMRWLHRAILIFADWYYRIRLLPTVCFSFIL